MPALHAALTRDRLSRRRQPRTPPSPAWDLPPNNNRRLCAVSLTTRCSCLLLGLGRGASGRTGLGGGRHHRQRQQPLGEDLASPGDTSLQHQWRMPSRRRCAVLGWERLDEARMPPMRPHAGARMRGQHTAGRLDMLLHAPACPVASGYSTDHPRLCQPASRPAFARLAGGPVAPLSRRPSWHAHSNRLFFWSHLAARGHERPAVARQRQHAVQAPGSPTRRA